LAKIHTLVVVFVATLLLQCGGSLVLAQADQNATKLPVGQKLSTAQDSLLPNYPGLESAVQNPPTVNSAPLWGSAVQGSAEVPMSRPVLYWRSWAANPPHLVPTFLFLLFVTVVLSELFRDRIVASGTAYSGFVSFCKTFGAGLMALIILLTFIRGLFSSQIGTPLAWALLAILQLSCLFGFAVSATVVGQSFCNLPLAKKLVGSKRWRRILVPLLGTLMISALMLIPKIGILSGIGIRLMLQLCILGLGACLRTRMGTIVLEASGSK